MVAGCQSQPKVSPSGFLSQEYYSQLQSVTSPDDQVVFRYISPDFNANDYSHAIVEKVVAYPEPQPTEQVSMKTLVDIQNSITNVIRTGVGNVLEITDKPGKGTLRMETAITGVNVSDKSLAAYEYIPTALVAVELTKVAGIRDQEIRLYLETRVTDTYTGELMGAGIRELTGENLNNARQKLGVDDFDQALVVASEDLLSILLGVFDDTRK
ncbi:DUF3313 domain-containing protein [Alcanivorax profundi]|uniref:DUF3313 domain-containing protein n=1 Tax=Alcanivorax profundi TaxID=2338368 RepID=A0A418XZF6_9GAMM|nr:DUF3313 domain-containing protein [Alcanivorax profundi]